MTPKTKEGVRVKAFQDANKDVERGASSPFICVGHGGELEISSSLGDQRRTSVKIILTLEEALAWLPEMIESAKKQAAAKARGKLIEDLWSEGYILTTSPRVKISPRSAP